MAPIQKPHPPTTPGAIYYTHGYTIGDEEIALLQTIMAVQKKAVEYLDSNEPNSDPRLRLVASRVAQWLPESIEHEQETPKAAVRRIAIELDDLWYNHRDTMEKLIKGDEELDPKALERAMRPREEAEAAHKAPLFDITVKRDGQEISLDNGPIVIGPGSSKVVFTCKRRRAPPAQPTANATTAAPRVAADDQAKASSHAAPTTAAPTTTDLAATELISAGSNATSAAPRSKTPASRRAANKDKDAAEDTDSPDIPTPIPKVTPEKRRKPSSRIEKAQIPALDLSGGAGEEEAPAPAEGQDDAAEDGAAGDDAVNPAPVAGPSKPRRALPRKAASSKASEPKPAAKPAKAKAAAKAAATKAAATKAVTTKAAAKKPAASKAAATKPTTTKAASKKPVASRAPTPEAPEPQEAAAGPSKPSANKRKRTEEVDEETAAADEARPTKGRKATKAQTTVEPARRSARTRAPVQRD
ncbi:hypothetical protein EV122DRAFT_295453 [Schizophyllum commune]